jgi:phosphoglycerate dehydrogenase-like enzyme
MESTLKVLITVNFHPRLLKEIEAVSPRLEVKVVEAREDKTIPEGDWRDAEILYTHKVLPGPDQAPELKWIQFHRAGNEAFMEAPILRKPGLQATTMSGASAPQVAEYILEMILALGHRLPLLMEHQQNANWASDRGEIFLPQELNRSTVGIIGYGSIGRQAARLLTAFGAQVLTTKQDAMQPADEDYMLEGAGDAQGDFVQRLYPAQALNSMLRECDFAVVCVPLTDDTRELVGEQQLGEMKPTAYLVDVSRGGVVDHAALITALKEEKIKGAALDVYPEEPLPQDSPLWKMPNVILTPHIAGASHEYNKRAVDLFIVNLERFVEGKSLLNLIDMQRGY